MNQSESIPAWWSEVAQPHLERIKQPHKAKKQATVMAVIHWRLLGIPIDWKNNKAVCAAQTWSSKWQHEPEVAAALHAIMDAIKESRQSKAAEAVDEAFLRIQESAGTAVEQILKILTGTFVKDGDRLNAAKTVLDRADARTANKAPQPATRDDVEEALSQVYGSNSR